VFHTELTKQIACHGQVQRSLAFRGATAQVLRRAVQFLP